MEPSMTRLSIPLLIFLLLVQAFSAESKDVEEFNEELLLKPLPDRKVLAHFHFESRAPLPSNSHGHHHHLFPKSISQLVQKFRVKEMELSFTQGRWNHEKWGGFDPLSSMNAKPVGVELWAEFEGPLSQVDACWKNLTNALSGLFCASINFLESSASYASPSWGFGPNSNMLRYGSLPREAVCTENLTPWLKLLPCRDKDGISALMHRQSIYRAFYHSHRLHLTTVKSGPDGLDSVLVLDQTLTAVLQPDTGSGKTNIQPSWSLSSLFGRNVVRRCVLAKLSKVYVQLEGFTDHGRQTYRPWKNEEFEFSFEPDSVLRETNSYLFMFDIDRHGDNEQYDLTLTWKLPFKWSCQQAPLLASRFLVGSGNERGAIAISLKSTRTFEKLSSTNLSDSSCTVHANVFQVFPWYIKVYYHTLQVFVDQKHKIVSHVIKKIKVSPSTDKMSLGVIEMMLELPCGLKSAAISLEFDKGFLHIDEYPPDANKGFDIPSALISFPNHHTKLDFQEESSHSPLLSKLEKKSLVRSYTEVLLVPFTTPDSSMPYNVILLTSLVCYLYFKELICLLHRRVAEEEKFLKSQAGKKKICGLKQLLSRISAKIRGRLEAGSLVLSSTFLYTVVLLVGTSAAWKYFSIDK